MASPLKRVQELYAASADHGAGDWGVQQYFEEAVADSITFAAIPYLTNENIDDIPAGALVRYRGMVQDMQDPEFYLGAFLGSDGKWTTSKFSDTSAADLDQISQDDMKIWERKPVHCTGVPGESAWVAQLVGSQPSRIPTAEAAPKAGRASKRNRDDDDADAVSMAHLAIDTSNQESVNAKQARLDNSEAGAAAPSSSAEPSTATTDAAASLSSPSSDCAVFVYDGASDDLKLNGVYEFIGVLSRAPELAIAHMEAGESCSCGSASDGGNVMHVPGCSATQELMEDEALGRLPTSLVPRLHAILVRRQTSAVPVLSPDLATVAAQLPALRFTALELLAEAAGGDRLVAEYLLLQLVSRVYSRGEEVLGTLTLNITGCPGTPESSAHAAGRPAAAQPPLSTLGGAIMEAMRALVARSVAIPVSMPELNSASYCPQKDYKSNRLVQGRLQLAARTQILLDETMMTNGQLQTTGIRNLQALKTLMEVKTVDYDFEFYQLPQWADAPVTILSDGPSMFKDSVDLVVPLQPEQSLGTAAGIAAAVAVSHASLAPVRAYLAAAQNLEFKIEGSAALELEQQLVSSMRSEDHAVDAVTTFHTWLTLARLLALSHGETSLTGERWWAMRALESQRQTRISGIASRMSA